MTAEDTIDDNPSIVLDGDWDEAIRILDVTEKDLNKALSRAMRQEALLMQKHIKQGIRKQAPGGERFKPLSPITLAIRKSQGFGGTKALINRGDLRNSIKVKQTGEGRWSAKYFIGVLKNTKSKDGKSLFNIAAVHEKGSKTFVIKVTKAMRGFLARIFKEHLGGVSSGGGGFSKGIIVSRIPARPFIRPVFEKYAKPNEIRDRFLKRVGELLGGDLGHL